MLIHRSDILAGIKALYIAQNGTDHLLKEDSYSCGYKEGFETALFSLAQLLGVSDEFEQSQPKLSRLKFKTLPVVNGQST
jgi:hypothetical protein